MKKEEQAMISPEIVSTLILSNDISKLTPIQRAEYVVYRSKISGVDPATGAFIFLPGKDGKMGLYATKECSSQLNQNRGLSPIIVSEGPIMGDSIYKVVYRVTEGTRTTEDCGAVALVVYQKATPQKPGEWIKMSAEGIADAIMKAHTKAKRRTILTHCGIGTNDRDDVPLVIIPDDEEVVKEASVTVKEEKKKSKPSKDVTVPSVDDREGSKVFEATLKEQPPEQSKHDEQKANGYAPDGPMVWRGAVTDIEEMALPDKRPCWVLMGDGTVPFKTLEVSHVAAARDFKIVSIEYHKNGKGTLVIDSVKEAK